eukprot:jgi/Botrbrau1/23326/Bobra.0102s0060.1
MRTGDLCTPGCHKTHFVKPLQPMIAEASGEQDELEGGESPLAPMDLSFGDIKTLEGGGTADGTPDEGHAPASRNRSPLIGRGSGEGSLEGAHQLRRDVDGSASAPAEAPPALGGTDPQYILQGPPGPGSEAGPLPGSAPPQTGDNVTPGGHSMGFQGIWSGAPPPGFPPLLPPPCPPTQPPAAPDLPQNALPAAPLGAWQAPVPWGTYGGAPSDWCPPAPPPSSSAYGTHFAPAPHPAQPAFFPGGPPPGPPPPAAAPPAGPPGGQGDGVPAPPPLLTYAPPPWAPPPPGVPGPAFGGPPGPPERPPPSRPPSNLLAQKNGVPLPPSLLGVHRPPPTSGELHVGPHGHGPNQAGHPAPGPVGVVPPVAALPPHPGPGPGPPPPAPFPPHTLPPPPPAPAFPPPAPPLVPTPITLVPPSQGRAMPKGEPGEEQRKQRDEQIRMDVLKTIRALEEKAQAKRAQAAGSQALGPAGGRGYWGGCRRSPASAGAEKTRSSH